MTLATHAGAARPGQPRSWALRSGEILAVAALYFLAARLGVLLAMPGSQVTPIWPPSGIALAAVLLLGVRVWPGIWLGAFLSNLLAALSHSGAPLFSQSAFAAVCTASGAALAALLGAWMVRRCVGPRHPLGQPAGGFALLGLGGAVACLLSATIGMLALVGFGLAPSAMAGKVWLTWWMGDAAGVIVVAPLLLAWGQALLPPEARLPAAVVSGGWFERLLAFAVLAAVSWGIFLHDDMRWLGDQPRAFLLFPSIVWIAVRYGPRGATLASALAATVAVVGTIGGEGPFHGGTLNESLLSLEVFLCMLALVAVTVAATVAERTRALVALAGANAQLDERVKERTAELLTANEALRDENARRAEAESGRRESEALYKALFEQSGEAILLVALDAPDAGRIVSANPSAAEMHGYTMGELLGLSVKDLSTPTDAGLAPGRMRAIVDSGYGCFQVEHRRKDGSIFSVEVSASLATVGGRRFALSIDRDITERLRAQDAARAALAGSEQTRLQLLSLLEDQQRTDAELRKSEDELRRSQSLMRRVLDATPVAIFAKDADSRILFGNEATAQFYGLTVAEITGRLQSELHASFGADPADIEKWLADDRAVLAEGQALTMEEQGTDRAGRRRWFNTRKDVFEFLPGQRGVLVSSEDITERKLAADVVERSRGELRALAARLQNVREDEQKRISREIHDELGQMLTALKMDMRWLERELDTDAGPTSNRSVLERAVAASALVDDTVKAVQRIAAGLRPGVLDRLGLPSALRQECRQFQERTGIVCTMDVPEPTREVPPAVATACYRVCLEALTNVARHAQAQAVRVSFREEAGVWRLEVCDDGRGLTLENRRRPGSLGLLGMEERALNLGGEFSIARGPEGGTIVSLAIPEVTGRTETA